MAFPKSKRKRLVVDGMPYVTCVSDNGYRADGGIRLRVIIQAEYGLESLCVIEGMVNRDFWLDLPDVNIAKTFSITPRVTCELIRHALANGWAPLECKTQVSVKLDNDGLFAIMKKIVDSE